MMEFIRKFIVPSGCEPGLVFLVCNCFADDERVKGFIDEAFWIRVQYFERLFGVILRSVGNDVGLEFMLVGKPLGLGFNYFNY